MFEGKKVKNFYVLRRSPHGRNWICICPCGRETLRTQAELLQGKKCEHVGARRVRHPVYMIWRGMKSRCYTSSDSSYKNYGAKGITVHPDWHSFDKFFADIGHTWRPGLSLDRREGTQPYSKDNCAWATVQEQNNNRSVNYQIDVNGEQLTLRQAVDHFGVVNYKTAHSRVVRQGWDPLKAASTPKK